MGYIVQLPDDKKLDIGAFSQILNKKYLVNSYKLYWLSGIMEEIKVGNYEIKFRRIVIWMVAKSWFTLLQFKLHFGVQDKLYLLVNYIYENCDLKINSSQNEVISYLENCKNNEVNKLITHFYRFVPFRLLTPFYLQELKNVREPKRNATIEHLSIKEPKLYAIHNDKIIVPYKWFQYLYDNQAIVDGWVSFKTISFLQSRNPNVPAIIEKINPPIRRNLTKVSNYWKEILKNYQLLNIYDKSILSMNNISIDHFIPWSFVHHDKVWNLLPVSKSVNSMKSDKLPDLDRFLDAFVSLQFKAFTASLKLNINQKLLEDYTLLPNIELRRDFPLHIFGDSLKKTITPLYQLAKNQGFQLWEY